VLGDDLVRAEQVEQQAQPGLIDSQRPAEGCHRPAAVLDQAVDQPELEGGLQRPRIDDRAQEFVYDQELQLRGWRRQRTTLADRVTSGETLAVAAGILIFAFGSRSALLLPR
jgi:hypothetical protein